MRFGLAGFEAARRKKPKGLLSPWRGHPGHYRSEMVIVRGQNIYYVAKKDSEGGTDYSWSTWRVPYDAGKHERGEPQLAEVVATGFSTRKRAYAEAEADAAKP